MCPLNPRKWRYTWEAQSHIPILKLFLFSPQFNPISHFTNLTINLIFEKSQLQLSWNNQFQNQNQNQNPPNLVTLIVPLPRVLVELESPLNYRALDDHIEVKIPLLLPVDHPIVSSFISDLISDGDSSPALFDSPPLEFLTPLSMDSDFKELSSKGDIDFCCRSCGFKLNKRSVRCLVDMPSVNWTDVADNWFGSCCCSFGSISEKLVANYVKLYRCAEGSCLLTTASIILCKDDVVGFRNLAHLHIGNCDDKTLDDSSIKSGCNVSKDVPCSTESSVSHDSPTKQGSMQSPKMEQSINGAGSEPDDHQDEKPSVTSLDVDFGTETGSEHHCCAHDATNSFLKDKELNAPGDLQTEQKSLLNCYLGNAFLFGSSGLSKDIQWVDFTCPQCSHILGAYPSTDHSEPLDGGIRLLKCFISISSPSGAPDELFRKYTLERMFTCQLLESAKDELSFRTAVKDLEEKCPMVNIILVNPNSWCCSGWCSEDTANPFLKINLHPVVKLLFSDNVKSEVRLGQEWELKHQVDEVYMLKQVISELIKSMEKAKDSFPPSFSSTEGFLLSFIPR